MIRTAHELGIPTTSTMMFGHAETPGHQARHLVLLRDLQRSSGGFTEFVPLSFVHTEAPMWKRGIVAGLRPGPTGMEVVRVHAVSRIVLDRAIPNLQVSWVKEGPRVAQMLLGAGANDLGGTLINESISTSAGAGVRTAAAAARAAAPDPRRRARARGAADHVHDPPPVRRLGRRGAGCPRPRRGRRGPVRHLPPADQNGPVPVPPSRTRRAGPPGSRSLAWPP